MDPLWAPWRMEFIKGARESACIFCSKPRDDDHLRENLILSRGDHAFVILNRYPYSNGHLLVVPYRHTSRYDDLRPDELLEMGRYVQRAIELLREEYGAEGFNVGLNLEKAAGAGIEEHLHIHVVPRWVGDTNFMPVIGETRTIPEHIQETYRVLAARFEG